jgi:hypothetical protein
VEEGLLIVKQALDCFAHDPGHRHFVLVGNFDQLSVLLRR